MLVAGIDIGGRRKGFHAVITNKGQYHSRFKSSSAVEMASWVHSFNPAIIAIDSPCKFAASGKSRKAERDLMQAGIHSFFTPVEEIARNSSFYGWVLNGNELYQSLKYPIFDGDYESTGFCIETFPNAIEKLMLPEPSVRIGKSKNAIRRMLLYRLGYASKELTNIDFVDAALCSIAAERFYYGKYRLFGNVTEGFIVVPS
jgi:predicted nuclease with RNAse H fold